MFLDPAFVNFAGLRKRVPALRISFCSSRLRGKPGKEFWPGLWKQNDDEQIARRDHEMR